MKRKSVKAHRKNPRQLELNFDLPKRGVFTPKIITSAIAMLKGKGGTTRRKLQTRFRWNDKRARRFIDRVAVQGMGLKIKATREGMDTRYVIKPKRKAG